MAIVRLTANSTPGLDGFLGMESTMTAQACPPFKPDWQQKTHLPCRNGLPGAPPLVQELFETGALALHIGQQSVHAGILQVQRADLQAGGVWV